MGDKARSHVISHFSKQTIQDTFRSYLSGLLVNKDDTMLPSKLVHTMSSVLVGPFTRTQSAHYDETNFVHKLFNVVLDGQYMIDVGAHHGHACVPFLDDNWTIYAFEPDNQNRDKLLSRLDKHKNKHLINLDSRCVSNKSNSGVSFYTSEQSTGIRGLSAFHETHTEGQKVDVTTLTEFFEGKPLPSISFLKIDTEGHDLFVLQGFPWDRGNPEVIECEFEDSKTVPLGYTFHDLAKFLTDKGYVVYVSEWHPIIRYGIRHDWHSLKRYPCSLSDKHAWGNLIAFRYPVDERILIESVNSVLNVSGTSPIQAKILPNKSNLEQYSLLPLSAPYLHPFLRINPGKNVSALTQYEWSFIPDETNQEILTAIMNSPGPVSGRSFVASFRISVDSTVTLNISLGSNSKSESEGMNDFVTLTPGKPYSIQLTHTFQHNHEALQLSIEEFPTVNSGPFVFTIEKLAILETLSSISFRLGHDCLNLKAANYLFRHGDYFAALGIYASLNEANLLSFYTQNIVRTSKKLGYPWITSSSDCSWIVNSVDCEATKTSPPSDCQDSFIPSKNQNLLPSTFASNSILNAQTSSSSPLNKNHINLEKTDRCNTSCDLSSLRNKYKGKRLFVMGNGPSLNKMNLELLANDYVFATNGCFLLFDRISWRPHFYTCVDTRVLPDRAPDIIEMHKYCPDMMMFFPKILRIYDGTGKCMNTTDFIPHATNRYFFDDFPMAIQDLPRSAFSLDAEKGLVIPHTVTVTMLQLAYFLGFDEIYLIGCDTSYKIPTSVSQSGPKVTADTALFLTSTQDDDLNHFDPSYFGKGRTWHNPKVEDMLLHYQYSKDVLDQLGIKVFNATVGGALEVFPRVDYQTLF